MYKVPDYRFKNTVYSVYRRLCIRRLPDHGLSMQVICPKTFWLLTNECCSNLMNHASNEIVIRLITHKCSLNPVSLDRNRRQKKCNSSATGKQCNTGTTGQLTGLIICLQLWLARFTVSPQSFGPEQMRKGFSATESAVSDCKAQEFPCSTFTV